MAGKVIRETAEWLIFGLVLFALLVELVLHKLEHWVAHRHPQLQAVLRNLYRELMIMGIVSFGFIMYIFIKEPNDDTKMTFEVAHIFIFLFAVFHTFVVGSTVLMSLRLSARWKRMERMDLVKYLDHKDKYRKLVERREKHKSAIWRFFGWWLPRPARAFQYRKVHEIMAFHDIRYQFIYYRNLQPDFRFSKFLRKIKSATFIELVEIHPLNWIIMLAIVLLDVLRLKAGWASSIFEPIFLMCHAVFNIVVVSVLAGKIRRVYWKLTKNPATYYDTVDRRAFEEELAILQEEAVLTRNSRSGDSEYDDGPSSRFSRTHKRSDRSRHSSVDKAHDNDDAHHDPVYAHMAYVPHKLGHDTPSSSRHSLDVKKSRVRPERGPAKLESFLKPKKYDPRAPIRDDSVAENQSVIAENAAAIHGALDRAGRADISGILLEKAKLKLDPKLSTPRVSVDLTADLPTAELDSRTAFAKGTAQPSLDMTDFEQDANMLKHMSTQRRKMRSEALRRLHEKRRPNAGIVHNAQDLEHAQQATPHKSYHWLLLKLIPRLGRVPSAAERLFWFGSHRYFLWCVEWVLFFTNINLSTTIAKLAFHLKEKKGSSKIEKASKFLLLETVRAPSSEKKVDSKKSNENELLLFIALGVSLFALVFVLVRIASIMKKYIFVLNNASLLPENMTIETIQTVNLKKAMARETLEDHSTPFHTNYDSELEEEDYSQMRRNVSSFLQNENDLPTAMSPVAEDPALPLSDRRRNS